ncbi:hypothetical protein DFH29DRAFT_983411 [Suillus ampliporus]|nr:hypothetical protein DFH29DRAFT_983411 [Suillus ampliporus]
MKAHDYEGHHAHNVYYPFSDREEWELAKFLIDNLNQGQITQFLKLLWASARKPPTFKSAQTLHTCMDTLPKGPKWCCTTIHTEGYITTHPVHLIWRDALEVMQHIFGNPAFANDMEFDPYKIYVNGEREYGEWMLDQLPQGATIVPIILASDKTPATTHTWSCIAYMPIPHFFCNPVFNSLLQARVWHRCVDIVCENLKITASAGTQMVDPVGNLHYTFTPLVSEFQDAAKALNLSGVQLPFWRDWWFADPAIFLAPDILHTCHKFFFNHILKWCKEVVGADELDSRFHSQHKHVGTRHFGQGVSHIQQMTGREHRDIQRTIVATIVGVVDANFVCAVHVLVDFIYHAQSPTFTMSTINAMTTSLQEFHHFKHSILAVEAHRGTSGPLKDFDIPKLELLVSFGRAIPNIGAPIQFTSETSERMLITHCKSPFTCTSHQRATFTQQIDTARQFDLYTLLRSNKLSLNNLIDTELDEVIDMDPAFSWVMCVAPDDVSHFQGPRPIHNHFLKGLLLEDSRAAFHVTVSSDLADKTSDFLAHLYQLADFSHELCSCIDNIGGPGSRFQTRLLKTWNKFHLQLHSELRPRLVMPSQQVQAYPPSTNYPHGNCDTMLLRAQGEDVIVAQVQMVFGLSMRGSTLPPGLAQPFIYVQLFEVITCPQDDPAVMMYRVRQQFETRPDGTRVRVGMIVPLVNVTHTIELIPVYGGQLNRNVTSATSLELYDMFYLNSFSDKEWYHTLHSDFV